MSASTLYFLPFRLDRVNERLWQADAEILLRPKAFALLRYLVEHPERLVSRTELVEAVWSGTKVSEPVLRGCLHEVRRALGDDVKAPRFLETVPRRGWRFIAPVAVGTAPVSSLRFKVPGSKREPISPPDSGPRALDSGLFSAPVLVGREVELAQLHRHLEKATNGERQFVFVTGEPGIGKTALVDAFLFGVWSHKVFGVTKSPKSKVQSPKPRTPNPELSPTSDPWPLTPDPWIARGQCIEHYGPGEAYLPVLEALERLCREPGCDHLPALLHRYAPMWLMQMPSLLEPDEQARLQRQLAGTTRERMLREVAVLFEALTAERILILVLEDLHWADTSTIELLAYLARRPEAARLLIMGTHRPDEVFTAEHVLPGVVQELQMHKQCHELTLPTLTPLAVSAYLEERFPHSLLPTRFAQALYEHTEGNPLFLVAVVEDLIARNMLIAVDGSWALQSKVEAITEIIPENLRQFISTRIEHLAALEQRIVEAGSIAGIVFSTAAVAAALETEIPRVEACCEQLTRHSQFLHRAGIEEWPDGTVTARYAFHHALYQHLCHERTAPTSRQQWHRRIGERLETAYGGRVGDITAELAVHFEQGRDYQRAVRYLEYAGQNAMQRAAYQEAVSRFTHGLALLTPLPQSPERAQQELELQVSLGLALVTTKGFAAPEVQQAYTRAHELCQQIGNSPQLFPILEGLHSFYAVRGEFQTALALGEQMLDLARSTQNPSLLLEAHHVLGTTLVMCGESGHARAHLEQGLTLYDPQQHHFHALLYSGHDPGVCCLSYLAFALWFLGYPDQAGQRSQEALSLAQEGNHPYSTALALYLSASFHQLRREIPRAQAQAEATLGLSIAQGFPYWTVLGTIMHGWALAEQHQSQAGIAQIQQGLAACRAMGAEIALSGFLSYLAEAYEKAGQIAEGFRAIDEALAYVTRTGERYYEAELYRLKGELTLPKEFKVQGSEFKVKNSLRSKVQGPKSSKTNSQILNPNSSAEADAEACFLKAIEIARKQHAKSWELRATMSLARLWQQQALEQGAGSTEQRAGSRKQGARTTHHEACNRLDEAHRMLSGIYSWFTEGFETRDLREAKTLLEELS